MCLTIYLEQFIEKGTKKKTKQKKKKKTKNEKLNYFSRNYKEIIHMHYAGR